MPQNFTKNQQGIREKYTSLHSLSNWSVIEVRGGIADINANNRHKIGFAISLNVHSMMFTRCSLNH